MLVVTCVLSAAAEADPLETHSPPFLVPLTAFLSRYLGPTGDG